MEGKIKVNIKLMNATISVEIEKTATVLNLKQKIKEQTKANEDDQKVIYKGIHYFSDMIGKILKDDDKLEAHNISDGDAIHLVIKKKPGGKLRVMKRSCGYKTGSKATNARVKWDRTSR